MFVVAGIPPFRCGFGPKADQRGVSEPLVIGRLVNFSTGTLALCCEIMIINFIFMSAENMYLICLPRSFDSILAMKVDLIFLLITSP